MGEKYTRTQTIPARCVWDLAMVLMARNADLALPGAMNQASEELLALLKKGPFIHGASKTDTETDPRQNEEGEQGGRYEVVDKTRTELTLKPQSPDFLGAITQSWLLTSSRQTVRETYLSHVGQDTEDIPF